MADAASSAGRAVGFGLGLESVRQRRIDEQQRAQLQQREALAQEADRFNLEAGRFDLQRARTQAGREDTAYQRATEAINRKNLEEGFADFAYALDAGVDPAIAMQKFNSQGQLKLRDVQFDRASKRLKLTDADGETQEFENPRQFLAAVGIQQAPEDLIKLGEKERLVTPGGREVVGAAGGAGKPGEHLVKVGDYLYDPEKQDWITPPGKNVIKAGDNLYDVDKGEWIQPPGGAGGRDIAPFNPETALGKIEQAIVRSHGGTWDELGTYSVPGDRRIVDMKGQLAGESFGRLWPYLERNQINYTELAEAVLKAGEVLQTNADLEKEAEAWRTKGRNKTDEEKAGWLSSKREEQLAEARASLAREEQKMMTRAQGHTAPPSTIETPEWAGEAVPPEALGDIQIQYGEEIDVEDESGRRVTLRRAADGTVYEVRQGKTEPPQSAPPVEPVKVSPEPSAAAPVAPVPAAQESAEDSWLGRLRRNLNEPSVGGGPPEFGQGLRTAQEIGGTALEALRGRHRRGNAPREQRQAVANARRALSQERGVPKKDVAILAALDTPMLQRLGLNDEQIAIIRALAAADDSLAKARHSEPEFTY